MESTRDYVSGLKCGSIILLAGAGSSCHLGLPDLDDLLERAVLGEDETARLIRQVRGSIDAQTRARPAVFEELIVRIKEYLESARRLHRGHPFRDSMEGWLPEVDNGNLERKWKHCLTKCYRVLIDEYGPDKITTHGEPIKATAELLETLAETNQGQLHVYTTNYDCSFQVLASNYSRLAFYTHIHNKKEENGRFTRDWYLSNPLSSDQSSYVYIHRLHGCVAWFTEPTSDDRSESDSIVREIYGAGGGLRIDDDDYLHKMCIKLVASELIGTNPAFTSAFEEFCSHLRQAEVLLIWGYSFRDLEVIRAINQAFSERQSPLRILYLDTYLREGKAAKNSEDTLKTVPIHISEDFRPRQIDWDPPDGLDTMASRVTQAIQKGALEDDRG
jgi:hypothetical protein